MAGFLWFILFQLLSCTLLLRRSLTGSAAERLWIGSVTGSVAAAWLPISVAFFLGFTKRAHLAAVLLALLFFFLLYRLLPRPRRSPDSVKSDHGPFLLLLLPLTALCVYLLCTHTICERNGALYSGQCSYGDMAMHLGFITSIAEQGAFPPEYSILPGVRLCYPFLCDSISSSLYLLGTPLRWAYMFPCFFALVQVFCGFYFLARRLCRTRGAALLAFVLFFFNGGLGMIYFLGKQGLRTLLWSFYKTPTNYSAENLRWVNVIVDMLLPQRATLFGWALLFVVLYLLFQAVYERKTKLFLPAGILGGLLPMIHTHSYFALGIIAACWLVGSLSREGFCKKWLRGWLCFGLPAVLIAAPQLIMWTFRSVDGNEQFIRFHLDWVNAGKESWFWFWLKNVGPMFLLTPLCFALSDKKRQEMVSPAVLIFLLCELIVFQPNVYDNNKLFYISYAFFCMLVADKLIEWGANLKRPSLGAAALSFLLVLCCHAALFTIAREIVSGLPKYAYELFSRDAVTAAEYIRENTEKDALFLTAGNHNNPVAALTGRNIYCGCPSYLFYHGLDYTKKAEEEKKLFSDPVYFEERREAYGIDYVYFSDYERAISRDLERYLSERYPAVFSSPRVIIYQVK